MFIYQPTGRSACIYYNKNLLDPFDGLVSTVWPFLAGARGSRNPYDPWPISGGLFRSAKNVSRIVRERRTDRGARRRAASCVNRNSSFTRSSWQRSACSDTDVTHRISPSNIDSPVFTPETQTPAGSLLHHPRTVRTEREHNQPATRENDGARCFYDHFSHASEKPNLIM